MKKFNWDSSDKIFGITIILLIMLAVLIIIILGLLNLFNIYPFGLKF
jgi:preprotein translocase subunit SecE